MGVRLHLFAVRDDEFLAFLHQTLGTQIRQFDADFGRASSKTHFQRPDRSEPIPRPSTAFESLAAADAWTWKGVFNQLATGRSDSLVRRVIEVERRSWIGSLLSNDVASRVLSSQDFACLRTLFAELLQGEDCGASMATSERNADRKFVGLAVPRDPDLRIGVWSQSDVLDAVRLVELIQAVGPSFAAPPHTGICDWTDWDETVRKNLDSLVRLDGLAESLVSFIL